MKKKDQILLEEAYNTVVNEFLGFGKKKEDENNYGVKFANLLAKGLIAKGFKYHSIGGGFQFYKDNGHGMNMIISMGGARDKFKETPVSVLVKYSDYKSPYKQELYKNWNFVSIQAMYPYRQDLSGADMDERKKAYNEDAQWEEEQRKKVGQIYDVISAFDDAKLSKLQDLLDQ